MPAPLPQPGSDSAPDVTPESSALRQAPDTPATPLARARLSLGGLRVGDCFGEQFARLSLAAAARHLRDRTTPPGPWPYTDDTLMAASVVAMLRLHGEMREEPLAAHFAGLFDPARGYGAAMHSLLLRLRMTGAQRWQTEAAALFDGAGSFGNGAAMRVASLGAFFADDLGRAAHQAARSARVTHAHSEAVAGAVAIAIAAALTWQSRDIATPPPPALFLATVRDFLSPGVVYDGISRAGDLDPRTSPLRAGALLGTGARRAAADTVPFALWSVARSFDFADPAARFEEALWQTVCAGGDTDTTCAMVGSILVLRTGAGSIPLLWVERAEPLPAALS